ncbi:MAG: PP2C family protein-serine/threonine phosphatase, partial [Bacteroidia bacterium]
LILVTLLGVFVCLSLLLIYPNITFHDLASSILAASASLIGIIIGVVAWMRGFPSARYYFFAYTFMLIGIIIFVLKDLAILPSNNLTEYVMHFGSGIEMVLLSLGLANKYNKLKKANEEAQQKIIENLKEIQVLQDKTNRELEEKVMQRTKEIHNQKILIEEKQKEIVDSINYAKRIQFALLANKEIIEKNTVESFILFKPKDIVSGDFYWASETNNAFYLACCDCTGHGVPGAFMSILNMSFLNQAVIEKGIDSPDEILNYIRTQITERAELGNDGMDATLIKVVDNKLSYASAVNKPLLVRNNELKELSADKMPVGKSNYTNSFNLYEQEILKDDIYYFYTDG